MVLPFGDKPKSTVLVIDEDRRTADSLAFALEVSGFRATAAYTGKQAMEFAAAQSFQFVVCDALAEIKGVKAPPVISEVFPDCNVLLMSSSGDSARLIEQSQTNKYRFDAFAKPVHPALLVERLRTYASALGRQKEEIFNVANRIADK